MGQHEGGQSGGEKEAQEKIESMKESKPFRAGYCLIDTGDNFGLGQVLTARVWKEVGLMDDLRSYHGGNEYRGVSKGDATDGF